MRFIYDLSKSPPTHDFINFLVRCEQNRIALGKKSIEIGFKSGMRFQSPRDLTYTQEKRDWRIRNLLMPLSFLLPSVNNVFMTNDGVQQLSYLNHQKITKPVLKAPVHAVEVVKNFLQANSVSITLRNSDFEPQRNSNNTQWLMVCKKLEERGYNPVVIPDAEAEMSGLKTGMEKYHYTPAAFNPELRLAVYENCVNNLMTQTGPILIALYSDVPLMAYKLMVHGIQCCEPRHLELSKMTPDDDWGPNKRLSWDHDYAQTIIGDFDDLKVAA